MVCVAVKGVPIIGVIHKPFIEKTAWSWTGHGQADSNNLKILKENEVCIIYFSMPMNRAEQKGADGKVEAFLKPAANLCLFFYWSGDQFLSFWW